MGYALQDSTVDRLSEETKRELVRRVEGPAALTFRAQWNQQQRDLVAQVRGVWSEAGRNMSLARFQALDVNARLSRYLDQHLRIYRGSSLAYLERFQRHAYREQYLRSTWLLDQVTPPNVTVRPKRDSKNYDPTGRKRASVHQRREAHRAVSAAAKRAGVAEAFVDEPPEGRKDRHIRTGEPQASYEHRWDQGLKDWGKGVLSAVAVGMLNDYTPEQEAQAVQSARMGGRDPVTLLDQMVRTSVNIAIVDAQQDVAEDQSGILNTKLWDSKDDARVCPTCEYLHGMTEDEVRAEFPYAEPGYIHDRCRCRWRYVPKNYADLAGETAYPGADPRALVIRDPRTGEPLAQLIVNFHQWTQGVQ